MVDNVLVAAVVAVVAVGIIAGASRAPLPLKKDRSRVGWTHGIVPCCNVQRPSRPQKHSQQRFSLSLSLSLFLPSIGDYRWKWPLADLVPSLSARQDWSVRDWIWPCITLIPGIIIWLLGRGGGGRWIPGDWFRVADVSIASASTGVAAPGQDRARWSGFFLGTAGMLEMCGESRGFPWRWSLPALSISSVVGLLRIFVGCLIHSWLDCGSEGMTGS